MLLPTLLDSLLTCAIIAVAASSLSLTLTQTELFAPYRALAVRLHPQIGHLATCFYCTSHWLVFAGIAVYQPRLITGGPLLVDLFVSAFFTVTLATFTSGIMFKAFLLAMAMHTTRSAMQHTAVEPAESAQPATDPT